MRARCAGAEEPEARERAVGSASGPVSLNPSCQQVGSDTGVPIPRSSRDYIGLSGHVLPTVHTLCNK